MLTTISPKLIICISIPSTFSALFWLHPYRIRSFSNVDFTKTYQVLRSKYFLMIFLSVVVSVTFQFWHLPLKKRIESGWYDSGFSIAGSRFRMAPLQKCFTFIFQIFEIVSVPVQHACLIKTDLNSLELFRFKFGNIVVRLSSVLPSITFVLFFNVVQNERLLICQMLASFNLTQFSNFNCSSSIILSRLFALSSGYINRAYANLRLLLRSLHDYWLSCSMIGCCSVSLLVELYAYFNTYFLLVFSIFTPSHTLLQKINV